MLRSADLLDIRRSGLLVIDVQERLLPVVCGSQQLVQSVQFLLDAAQLLNVPAVVSEQYPKGLGPTIEPLGTHAAIRTRFEKLTFSAAAGVLGALPDCDQLVLTGIETHVCVLQTAMDLQSAGRRVFLAADAVSSRHGADHQLAIARLRDAGCTIVSAESVVFEWCQEAGTDSFRAVSRLVRERDQQRAQQPAMETLPQP